MLNGQLWEALAAYDELQLSVALAIVIIVALSWLGRFYLSPGAARLAQNARDRDDAVGILKAQLKRALSERDEEHALRRALEDENRQLQTQFLGFAWLRSNPAALRALADALERQNQNTP